MNDVHESESKREFRVFFEDGSRTDVGGQTFGRDGADWVIYDGDDVTSSLEVRRFASKRVNGIALRADRWRS